MVEKVYGATGRLDGLTAMLLRANGYDVTEVATGEAALDAAVTAPWDLMILDLVLPDLDGVEVCRRLREWSQLPVVVLSALGE